MNDSLLITYSTTDGHTPEICERLKQVAESSGLDVTVTELPEDASLDIAPFGRIVIGASIRYGKHKPEVKRFIDRHQEALENKKSAFFSVNAVARKPEKQTAETNPYVRKFLASIDWKPAQVGIFAGKIDYPAYTWFDRTMIRLIMRMTKGPTDPAGTFEFTDWDTVEAFGRDISR